MRNSRERILTSHVGSLSRPDTLIAANKRREEGQGGDEAAFQKLLQAAVVEVVQKQKNAGIDVPNDGEFGKSMGQAVNYRAWLSYAFARLSGLQMQNPPPAPPRPSGPHDLVMVGLEGRRDRTQFAAAYTSPDSGVSMGPGPYTRPVCTGPVSYVGQAAIKADIAHLNAALAAAGIEEGFMTAIAPGAVARLGNLHYKTDDDFLFACADAMHEEYKAIVDAGLILQLDDPGIAENWDAIVPPPSLDAYKRFTMVRVEALNHAIRGLPPDRVRFHLCWGSWHGPHMTDLPLRDIVEVMLQIKAGGYSFEAANARHEHEYRVWEEVKLPEDRLILPGIVSHATNVVEHPELVAERILRFTRLVGRERVIAATDCGLGGRIHPDIAWAKLAALAEGAALASRRA
jgi:5-methyltetrahydropteroyltriglutamate--homocysteine methyltransferase